MVLLRVLLEGLMLRYFFTIIIALWAMSVSANVVITGTRVIYPSNQKTVSVQLTNVGTKPSLVQAWIDNGDPICDYTTDFSY